MELTCRHRDTSAQLRNGQAGYSCPGFLEYPYCPYRIMMYKNTCVYMPCTQHSATTCNITALQPNDKSELIGPPSQKRFRLPFANQVGDASATGCHSCSKQCIHRMYMHEVCCQPDLLVLSWPYFIARARLLADPMLFLFLARSGSTRFLFLAGQSRGCRVKQQHFSGQAPTKPLDQQAMGGHASTCQEVKRGRET